MRGLRIAVGLALITSVLLACSGSVTGGVIGAIVTLAAGIGMLTLGASTQTGCSSPPVQPCLSIEPEHLPPAPPAPGSSASATPPSGPRKTTIDLQPCLTPFMPEPPALDAGPPPAPDAGPPTAAPVIDVGPCLSPPKPEPEMRVCLSELTIDPPQGLAPSTEPSIDKAAIKDKLIALGALPPDVIDRLR